MFDPLAVELATRYGDARADAGPARVLHALGHEDALPVCELELGAAARAVAGHVAHGSGLPLVAGECLFAGAVLSGLRARGVDAALLWLDAHADLNTPQTSGSGLLVGMSLAATLGRCLPEVCAPHDPPLPESHVALVGVRDLDRAEADAIASGAILHADSVADVIDRLPDLPVHVHLDADVLDPSLVEAGGYGVAGGWDATRLAAELSELLAHRELAGLSVCAMLEDDGSVSPEIVRGLDPILPR